MADRYWVGGAGTWNTTNTTNWSTTSGGAGGASVPTSADNVFFDANSGGGAVSASGASNASVCADLTFTGFTGTFTIGNFAFSCYGNLTLANTATYTSTTNGISMLAANKTITSNGATLNATLYINYSGTQLADNLNTSSKTIQLNSGSLTTNNFSVTCGSINVGPSGATLNCGSSTFNLSGTLFGTYSGTLTLNAGTSTFNVSVATAFTTGRGLTYYNVNFTGGSTTTIAFTGANTFNNLSFTANTSGTKSITFDSTNTINGTLSTSGTTAANRIQFGSSVAGTQRTLSVANTPSVTNSNFQDIALTGAASPWTAPLGVWNLGNNSGITFDTTTLYRIGAAGEWNDSTKWSTSSGGSAASVAPGPTNNVIFDTSSGTGTVSFTTQGYCKDITVTATQSIVFSNNGTINIYGSLAFPTGGSFSPPSQLFSYIFYSSAAGNTINFGNKSFAGFAILGGGEYILANNITGYYITVTSGTFRTANYNIGCDQFASSGTGIRAVYLGSSSISCSGSIPWEMTTTTNLTFDAGTSSITLTYTAFVNISFRGGGLNYYNLTTNSYNYSGYSLTISGANTFNNLTINRPNSNGLYSQVVLSANQIVNGTFSSQAANPQRRAMVTTDTVGTSRTITAANVSSLSDVDFYGITGAGTATWSGTRLGNVGSNSGITFDAAKTVYWSLAAGGSFASSNAWATSSGGTPDVNNYPLPQDTVIFDNTGLNTSATVQVDSNGATMGTNLFKMPGIDCSARTNAMTLSWNRGTYLGCKVVMGSGVTNSGTGAAVIGISTPFTSSAITWTAPITVNINGTMSNTDAFTSSSSLTNNGTLTLGANATFTVLALNGTTNLSTYTLFGVSCTLGAASTTNFGTGKISLTGNAATIFTGNATQTVTGTPVIDCTYSGATGTRTISPSTPTESNTISFNVTAGTDTFVITSSQSVKSLDFTGFSGIFTATPKTIYGGLTLSSGMTVASSGTNYITFAGTSGPYTITTNGKTVGLPIAFNGVGGTWILADNFTQGSTVNTNLTNGTLDLNGKTYTAGIIFGTQTGTKNITFNGGTLVCTGTTSAFNNSQPTGFTTTAGTGTGKISMTSASAKTFAGGGSTYNCTLEQAGAGALTITGSNTFNDITNTTQPVSVLFTAGTTNTFNNFSLSGTSGNLVTIGSVTAASHTLSKSSGIVNVSYCTISYSTATGGARWQAYTTNGNVNGGNNSGWKFSAFSGNGLFFGSNF